MDKELFEQLHQSMKEAVAIAKGEMQPSRVFTVAAPDVKAVREKTGLSQSVFAAMIGVQRMKGSGLHSTLYVECRLDPQFVPLAAE